MLESLQIQNFQCHSRMRIDFDPAVTTIVGDSDRGKSAIIRALRWVATNSPSGDAFIRDGSKGATVTLRTDGGTIVRRRGKGKNEYSLGDHEYKAFGAGVPDPVAATINVCPTNFAGQHDASFWFALSPPEVSRQLNEVVDLKIIDDAMGAIAGIYRHATATVDVSKDRLESARKQVDELAWVPEALADFACVSTADAKHAEISTRMAAISCLTSEAGNLSQTVATSLGVAKAAVVVGKRGKVAIDVAKCRNGLARRLDDVHDYGAVLVRGVPDMSQLVEAVSACQNAQTSRGILASTIREIKAAEETRCQTNKRAEVAAAKLEQAMKGRCPICGGTV